MRSAILLALALPTVLGAQTIALRAGEASDRPSAVVIRDALAGAHVVLGGSGRLDLPRDSTVKGSLIVIGRPTYLASRVDGDVVVIGGDLFLRPGVRVSGKVAAIGGTVSLTTLGRVDGATSSFRSETYDATRSGDRYELTWRPIVIEPDPTPLIQLAGVQGLLMPRYNRIEGFALPIGALITLGNGAVEIEPSVAYRSRYGDLAPEVRLTVFPERSVYFEGRVGTGIRSNERWIYSDLVNSANSLVMGNDVRNYFGADGGEGRLFTHFVRPGRTIEAFVGGRYEEVHSVTTGGVFSIVGRRDPEKIARPNPAVESGRIGSGLAGARVFDTSGVVKSRLVAEVEQGFETPTGTSSFTQLTLDGRVGFPTFSTQRLQVRAHAVTTITADAPLARHAYLGHGGTLPLLETLEQGGDELLFVESRYFIPLDAIVLPLVGSPELMFRHIMGSAGVGALPRLEQQIGAGIALSLLRVDVTTDVARNRGTKVGFGVSLGR